VKCVWTAVLLPAIVGAGDSPAFPAQDAIQAAFVEDVSGQVVAFSQGSPPWSAPSTRSIMEHNYTSQRTVKYASVTIEQAKSSR
jgi:hypothetical protein